MSPLVLLGLLGTALSTVFMLPHLATALRDGHPAGSAFAWALTASQSSVWFLYGLVSGDLLVAAPGFVTVPIGLTLTTWAYSAERRAEHAVLPAPEPVLLVVRQPEREAVAA